jgi:endoglucanase
VRNTIIQAGHAQAIPIVVPYYRPYRDCTTSLRSGTKDAAAYRAWIDGFGRGIGNERAVVIYEPSSSVTIPHSTFLDGTKGYCNPTDQDGWPIRRLVRHRARHPRLGLHRLQSLGNHR